MYQISAAVDRIVNGKDEIYMSWGLEPYWEGVHSTGNRSNESAAQ